METLHLERRLSENIPTELGLNGVVSASTL